MRHFLTDYALRQAADNYAVVRDSLSLFLDVLCTTMNRCVQGNDGDHNDEGAAAGNGGYGQPAVDVVAAVAQPAMQRNIEPEPAGLISIRF